MKLGHSNRFCFVFIPARHQLFFRVFGYGLSITDHRLTKPYWSERNGRRRPKPRHVGPWCFAPLMPRGVGA